MEYLDYVTTVYNYDDYNEFNSYPHINFLFSPVPKKLELELGFRMDHFFA